MAEPNPADELRVAAEQATLNARAFNAVLPALREAGEWLPLSARKAVAVAVVDELKPELDAPAALREVARGYCPECGRGDAAPTVQDWERERDERGRLEIANRALNTAAVEAVERAERAEALAATPRELELRQRSAWINAGRCPKCGHDDTDGRLCPDCTTVARAMRPRERREWRRYEPFATGTPIQSHGYTPAGLLGIAIPDEPTEA